MFERAFQAFSWVRHSCAHLAERTETERVKFAAQGTQQASEKQGPECRATEPGERDSVLTTALGPGAHL